MLSSARRRNNEALAREAWALSWTVTPHVDKRHRNAVTPRVIVMGAPGFDPDPEEIE